MVANVTVRANKAEMLYVGETPWHGLGQKVEQGITIDEAAIQAGMEWEAVESEVIYNTPTGVQQFADKKVLYRSDTNEALSVVGADFKVVQPREVLEFFRDLTEEQGWHIHTAGTLGGGKRIWAMASSNDTGEVTPGDRVEGNILLATGLDGSMRTTACMTPVRVVCQNTLTLALKQATKKASVSHRSEFDGHALKQQIGVAHETFFNFMESARRMAETHCSVDEAREILRELFGKPVRMAEEVKTTIAANDFTRLLNKDAVSTIGIPNSVGIREQKSVRRCLELFEGEAMGADMAKGSRWGLLNAVTQHLDWERGRTADARIGGSWFGLGEKVKTEAIKLLTA